MVFVRRHFFFGLLLFGALGILQSSFAGVFSTTRFVEPGAFSLGLEPEVVFSDHAGVAGNFRYTHGLGTLTNGTFILGTGEGDRHFRVGSQLTFDFFPDLEGQPGMGIGTQILYYRLRGPASRFEWTLVPYIHKSFQNGTSEYDPFIAFPIGIAFEKGNYEAISTLAVGSTFKQTQNLYFVVELGIAVNNTDSYFSGGILYYY